MIFKKRAWHEQQPRGERALRGIGKAVLGIGVPLALLIALITALTAKPGEQPPPPELATADSIEEGASLTGAWTLSEGWVGYRILEDLPRLRGKHEAVGRTDTVEATVEIEGSKVADGRVLADLTQLTSDQASRDKVLEHRYLETGAYPEASFVFSGPFQLPSVPETGEVAHLTVTGELTLHGVTREEDVDLEVLWTGSELQVVGGLQVFLADYDIRPPRISGFRLVDDEADIEFDLTFTRQDGEARALHART